jgi:hypothetical protein
VQKVLQSASGQRVRRKSAAQKERLSSKQTVKQTESVKMQKVKASEQPVCLQHSQKTDGFQALLTEKHFRTVRQKMSLTVLQMRFRTFCLRLMPALPLH